MMARQVMTLTGPIEPEQLGFTSMHEHVLMTGHYMHKYFYQPVMEHPLLDENDPTTLENICYIRHNGMATYDAVDLQNSDRMLLELGDFRKTGGKSMLDCTAVGIRSNMAKVRELSERTHVNVIGSTGFYMSLTWPAKFHGMSEQQLQAFMEDEIMNGIEGVPGCFPGALKVAMCDFNEEEERALRAAARISKENDMCLTLHPPFRDVPRCVDIVLEEGMKPENFILAHVNFTCFEGSLEKLIKDPTSWNCFNPAYLQSFFDRGINLSFECFGNSTDAEMNGILGTQDWATLAYLYHFVQKGYAKQIVMGDDICTDMCTRRGGGEGYTRQTIFMLNTMRKYMGLSEDIIDTITKENPKRLLTYNA